MVPTLPAQNIAAVPIGSKDENVGNIQIYLIHQAPRFGMRVEIFEGIRSAHRRWIDLSHRTHDVCGLLFVGVCHPSLTEARRITSRWGGCILIAESCRWSLPTSLSSSEQAIDELPGCPQHPEMACYLGGAGWASDAASSWNTSPRHSSGPKGPSGITGDDIFESAARLPSWAIDIPIDDLPLPCKCGAVFRRNGVNRLGDLRLFTKNDALRWHGCGQNSLKHSSDILRAFLRRRAEELQAPRATTECVSAMMPMISLARSSLSGMSPRDASIWKARVGLDQPRQTLQQFGRVVGLTRERVRQIEVAIAKRYQSPNPWVHAITPRIKRFLETGASPLHIEDLEREDEWFKGISAHPQVLNSFLRFYSPLEVRVSEDSHRFVTRDGKR